MSRTTLTILLVGAGVVIVALLIMLSMGGGMMGGMGGMMYPMCVFAWIVGIGLIAVIIFALVRLTHK